MSNLTESVKEAVASFRAYCKGFGTLTKEARLQASKLDRESYIACTCEGLHMLTAELVKGAPTVQGSAVMKIIGAPRAHKAQQEARTAFLKEQRNKVDHIMRARGAPIGGIFRRDKDAVHGFAFVAKAPKKTGTKRNVTSAADFTALANKAPKVAEVWAKQYIARIKGKRPPREQSAKSLANEAKQRMRDANAAAKIEAAGKFDTGSGPTFSKV
jgi:hypothetical protein